jgi:UDP-N-acetylglucosamine transferase subunit ALG13
VIYVTLGTHEQPMERLRLALEGLPALVPELAPFVIQHGYTRPPAGWRTFRMVSPEENRAFMQQADIVVTHGGPASIAEARESGSIPIVVPRQSAHDEHVDDHQLAYARRLAAASEVVLVEDPALLGETVRGFSELSRQLPRPQPHDPAPAIRRLAEVVDLLVGRGR